MLAEKLLTREEIDALLKAIEEGLIEPEKELAHERGGAVNFDLFSASKKNQALPNMDLIYDGFIRYNRVTMSGKLRKMVEYKKLGHRGLQFDDFILSLPSPVCMSVFKIDPLKGAAMIAFDSNLVFAIVDSMLGGTGSSIAQGHPRMFSSIESRIVQKIAKDMLIDLEKAWAPLGQTKMSILRMETNPRLVNIVPPEYQVVTMSMEMRIDDTKGVIVFAIPFILIDPIKDKLKSGAQFDLIAIDPLWNKRLNKRITEIPLDVVVELGQADMTTKSLLQLECGDIVMLDRDCRDTLPIAVEDNIKLRGRPGLSRGSKAVEITEVTYKNRDKEI